MSSLDGWPPGSEVQIRGDASFSPMCRSLTSGEDIAVTRAPGVRAVIQLEPAGSPVPIDQILIVAGEGSDCPIPLSRVGLSPLAEVHGKRRFLTDDLPSRNGDVLCIQEYARSTRHRRWRDQDSTVTVVTSDWLAKPLRHRDGVLPTSRRKSRLKCRIEPKPASNAISLIDRSRSDNMLFASAIRRSATWAFTDLFVCLFRSLSRCHFDRRDARATSASPIREST